MINSFNYIKRIIVFPNAYITYRIMLITVSSVALNKRVFKT